MAADDAELRAKLKRLERRLERERGARQEAEQIAETGLRSLYDANQELDKRILTRTAELHHALQAAEAASSAKSAFLGQMSHQINTPLNGLLGMLELLSDELVDAQAVDWHASATRSAQRLARLTTRLIRYVELEHADLTERGYTEHLGALLRGVHDRWHARCLRAGQILSVELRPGADVVLYAPEETAVLFDELLSNAVDHAGPGAVTIVGHLGDDRDEAIVEVHDPGAGLDPEMVAQPHMLNVRPDQTQRGDNTVNLGLALVDRIVTGLGARWSPLPKPASGVVVKLPVVR